MKFNERALANASGVWIGVVYLLCGFAVAVFPGLTRTITTSWFHGMDMGAIWSAKPFPGNFLLGLISAVALTWIASYLFAYLYNYFLAKK